MISLLSQETYRFFSAGESSSSDLISNVLLSNKETYTSGMTLRASSLVRGASNICVAG